MTQAASREIGTHTSVAIACDLTVMSKDAAIGFNFVRLGIHPGMGGSWMLPKQALADGDITALPSGTGANASVGDAARRSTTVAPFTAAPLLSRTSPLGSM